MDRVTQNKAVVAQLRAAMVDFEPDTVKVTLRGAIAANAVVHMCFPFGDMVGPDALFDQVYAPLLGAAPDLERRDTIVIGGVTESGQDWVGCCGFYCGTFVAPWLDIPPSGHLIHMRFHEFYRIVDGQIVEIQTIWDIPELMMQANAWPMAPSLGRDWCVPSPATQDGIVQAPFNKALTQQNHDHVVDMLVHLSKHPSQGGPEVMQAEKYWHPCMNWYGPAGIGSARGLDGFRNWHQIPFLNALPDRQGGTAGVLQSHFFGQGAYVGVTGWPNMEMTLTGAGWMGIAPTGTQITMRSLDFWRLENGLIRENWVLVDLLDVYDQIGVDVFARLREYNKGRFGMEAHV